MKIMKRPERKTLNSTNLSLMGIPKKFHSITLNDFSTFGNNELQKVKSFFEEYITSFDENIYLNKGVFLYGSNGVGKTMLSCILVKEAYRKRYSAHRATFMEYINAYTKVWGASNLDEKEYIESSFYNSFKAVEFLVLEEVGKEVDSKVATPILEDCLRYREDKGLVTIICTNMQVPAFRDRYGESCFSLLQGNMTPIKIESDDNRKSYFNNK